MVLFKTIFNVAVGGTIWRILANYVLPLIFGCCICKEVYSLSVTELSDIFVVLKYYMLGPVVQLRLLSSTLCWLRSSTSATYLSTWKYLRSAGVYYKMFWDEWTFRRTKQLSFNPELWTNPALNNCIIKYLTTWCGPTGNYHGWCILRLFSTLISRTFNYRHFCQIMFKYCKEINSVISEVKVCGLC